ncbi:MAG TPA: methanol oxidation system protein MoxJ [Methylophilus sp.]|nr:methanol oxidation system protein MoxJ [Methylophilus sp.]
MFPEVKNNRRTWLRICLSVTLSVFALPTLAASALNICAGKSELPFSNDQKQGFENKIAAVIGKSLNVPVNYFWWTNPLTLQKDMEEGKCDVLIGTDPSDPRVLTTKPYYSSGYVFVTRKDREIDITSWDHPYLKEKSFRIGVMPDSPGKNMLLQINRFDDMFDYFTEIQNFQSTRNRYVHVEPSRLMNDVSNMHLHMAMLWAPEAARYVRASEVPLNMVMVEDTAKKTNGEKIPMHYKVAMGVSKQHPELVEALNRVIETKGAEITAILKDEGIPLLNIN